MRHLSTLPQSLKTSEWKLSILYFSSGAWNVLDAFQQGQGQENDVAYRPWGNSARAGCDGTQYK